MQDRRFRLLTVCYYSSGQQLTVAPLPSSSITSHGQDIRSVDNRLQHLRLSLRTGIGGCCRGIAVCSGAQMGTVQGGRTGSVATCRVPATRPHSRLRRGRRTIACAGRLLVVVAFRNLALRLGDAPRTCDNTSSKVVPLPARPCLYTCSRRIMACLVQRHGGSSRHAENRHLRHGAASRPLPSPTLVRH